MYTRHIQFSVLIFIFAFCGTSRADETTIGFAHDLISKVQHVTSVQIYSEFAGVPNANTLYRALPGKLNWREGYSTVFVGLRKPGYPILNFAQKITNHINFVRHAFPSQGLRGYLFLVTGEYEIAFQNWVSKDSADRAFASNIGQQISQDAVSFMSPALFEQMTSFDWLNKLK